MAASTLSETCEITPLADRADGERTLRAARARRPATGPVPRPLEGELTFLFARSYARTWPIGLALTLAVFFAATLWFPIEALAPSFLVVVGASVVTGAACRHYAASRPVVVVRRWRR